MMDEEWILEQIWRGAIRARHGSARSRFARRLAALLPVRAVSLVVVGTAHPPRLMREDHPLLPGLPLGDVLAEELDLWVPPGAAVVIEGAGFDSGHGLSADLIDWLVDALLPDFAVLCGLAAPAVPAAAAAIRGVRQGTAGRSATPTLHRGGYP